MWARSDERHLTAQYVDELRQFIDARLAQEAADAGSPRIVLRSLLNVVTVFRNRHGAELEYDDLAFIAAMPTLPEEHGPGGIELYGHRDRHKQRHRYQKADAGKRI